MLPFVILADLLILNIRSHIEFGTPVFSGVTSRGLKTYKLKGSILPHSVVSLAAVFWMSRIARCVTSKKRVRGRLPTRSI